MFKTTGYQFAIFLFFCLLISPSSSQKAAWQGTTERIDGVVVVKNPKDPMYGDFAVEFEEELSIGQTAGREEYMFSLLSSIDVDFIGNIYALDVKEAHIKVYDSDGKFIRQIGRRGQGPGEFQNPHTVQITPKNKVVVCDPLAQKLLYFSTDGKYQESIPTLGLFGYPIIDSDGFIVSLVKNEETKNPMYELHRLDRKLEPLNFYCSYPKPDFTQQVINPFRSYLIWALGNNDEIICGMPDDAYELKIFDQEGKLVRRLFKDYNPVKITDKEIESRMKGIKNRDKYSIPEYHGAFRFVILDDDNRIFVCTWERTKDWSASYYDVFDSEGKYMAKILIQHSMLISNPIVFKGSKLYLVQEDEDGYQYVKRYKVNWKIK
jgi:hypothetical protein